MSYNVEDVLFECFGSIWFAWHEIYKTQICVQLKPRPEKLDFFSIEFRGEMEFGPTMEGTAQVETAACVHCDQVPILYCVECEEYYCSTAADVHKASKKTSRHQLQEVISRQLTPKVQTKIVIIDGLR